MPNWAWVTLAIVVIVALLGLYGLCSGAKSADNKAAELLSQGHPPRRQTDPRPPHQVL
ncbi:MAG: hypothetical protein WCT27_04740 [Patescibacteria group bacterium]|jgi:hypothetical protein